MELDFYKEQLLAKEDMLARTTGYLMKTQQALEEKNTRLKEVNTDLLDSIKFAELIQKSLLPDVTVLKTFVSDAAYLVKQQMGIGGDTVFIRNTDQGVAFGLLDSTGHGIPAAMLSISGLMMLNELASAMKLDSPKVILKLLNYQLNTTFNGERSIAHMEGIACFFSSRTRRLTYCSAKGKAFHLAATGEISELQHTRHSIGEDLLAEYEDVELAFKSGDKLFLHSDGLTDQFGGEKNKKFSKSSLRRLLTEHGRESAGTLRESIEQAFNSWKGATHQTDDVSFMIIEF